jgi:hypothetical protein
MTWLWFLMGVLLVALLVLSLWRLGDARVEQRAWNRLMEMGRTGPTYFDPALIADLPEPAQRFFNFTIQPGAPLHPVVEIEMTGELSLGSKDKPTYRPMHARQLLAAPHGFIWSLAWNGVRGSDGAVPGRSWTRFWLFGLIPVARASGTDHLRSSFGRLIADSVFWAPASLLPSEHARWEALGEHSARVVACFGGLEQAVDLHVDETGQLQRVVFQRWSDANPEREYRLQPFGGDFSDFRNYEGYRLPTTVVAGNLYGTDDYFPFFKAQVTAVRFPG